jgi:uncharacterized membrane protein YgdD (TMEM256/DUF423 family)
VSLASRASVRLAVLGAVLGFCAVAAGAMGAHALRERLIGDALEWWRTAAQYAQIHAVAAIAVATSSAADRSAVLRASAAAFLAGIVVFSGTLFVMALGGPRWLGAITPLGGLFLLAGWAALAVGAWQARGRATSG